jgi:hypothetical protein
MYFSVLNVLKSPMQMKIWEQIHESRQKKEIVREAPASYMRFPFGSSPETVPRDEFGEMEKKAQKAIEEYVSTPLSEVSPDLELRACDAILKYLVFNSFDLDKCSVRSLSRTLGIPRSRLRMLLARMERDGVVRTVGIGTARSYQGINLAKAMKEGYFTLSREEAEKMARFAPELPALKLTVVADGLVSSIPEAKVYTDATIEIANQLVKPGQDIQLIYTPFRAGDVFNSTPGYSDFAVTTQFLKWPFMENLVGEVLMELDVPDEVTPQDIQRGLRNVALKYLRLVRLSIKPLLDLLKEHGFEDGRGMIEKAYHSDRLLKQETDPTGRRIPRHERRRGVGKTVPWGASATIPGHGLVTPQTQELTHTHIRLLGCVYRAACNLAEHVGGDPNLIQSCRKEALELESFVEPQ